MRNSLEQIFLWRQRDEAAPQIFELLIGDLVKRLLPRLIDTEALERELTGAEPDTARTVGTRVITAMQAVTEVGDDSRHRRRRAGDDQRAG